MTFDEVDAVLAMFAGTWQHSPPSETTTDVWGRLLRDEPSTCAEQAATEFCMEPGRRFPPTPGDFVERRRQLSRRVAEQRRLDDHRRALPEVSYVPPAEARAEIRTKLDELVASSKIPSKIARRHPQIVHPAGTPKCRACGLPTDAVDDKGPCHPWCTPLDALEEVADG